MAKFNRLIGLFIVLFFQGFLLQASNAQTLGHDTGQSFPILACAKEGNDDCRFQLARAYAYGDRGLEKDFDQALHWLNLLTKEKYEHNSEVYFITKAIEEYQTLEKQGKNCRDGVLKYGECFNLKRLVQKLEAVESEERIRYWASIYNDTDDIRSRPAPLLEKPKDYTWVLNIFVLALTVTLLYLSYLKTDKIRSAFYTRLRIPENYTNRSKPKLLFYLARSGYMLLFCLIMLFVLSANAAVTKTTPKLPLGSFDVLFYLAAVVYTRPIGAWRKGVILGLGSLFSYALLYITNSLYSLATTLLGDDGSLLSSIIFLLPSAFVISMIGWGLIIWLQILLWRQASKS